MKVLLVYGGASPEHEVSIRSAKTIYEALSKNHDVWAVYITKSDKWFLVEEPGLETENETIKYDPKNGVWQTSKDKITIDIVFPIVHGVGGEDGVLQSMLDEFGVKYVGTKAKASQLCFDKVLTKKALREKGINVVDEIIIENGKTVPSYSECQAKLGDTLFIKPSRSGSSVGVHKVSDASTYDYAVEDALKYDDKVLIEKAVSKPRELEMAVLETEPGVFDVSAPGEIVADGEFYTYDAKYATDSKSETVVNPEMSENLKSELRRTALDVNQILGCNDMVRIDFLQDGETGKLYLNEVNTLPGFTSISMYPMLWKGVGMTIDELVDTMVRVARKR